METAVVSWFKALLHLSSFRAALWRRTSGCWSTRNWTWAGFTVHLQPSSQQCPGLHQNQCPFQPKPFCDFIFWVLLSHLNYLISWASFSQLPCPSCSGQNPHSILSAVLLPVSIPLIPAIFPMLANSFCPRPQLSVPWDQGTQQSFSCHRHQCQRLCHPVHAAQKRQSGHLKLDASSVPAHGPGTHSFPFTAQAPGEMFSILKANAA